jgi:hypothetical protein
MTQRSKGLFSFGRPPVGRRMPAILILNLQLRQLFEKSQQ